MTDFKHGPKPVPTLTGKDAEEFIKQNSKPLTKKQKTFLKKCQELYEKNPVQE